MNDGQRSGCPINLTLEVVGDKWSLLIIRDMIFGNRRHFRELLLKSEEGIASRNFVGAAKYIRWSDLRSVRYVPPMKWFRLETQSGTVGRVSVKLRGLPEFARLLLHNAPAGAIEAQTLDVLRTTTAGNPPSVWR